MNDWIGITLVDPNGQMHKMKCKSDSVSFFINNLRFINKDPIHIAEFLKHSSDTKAEWKKENPDIPYEVLSPVGHGMVVIDMSKNRIYSAQGYVSIGRISKITDTPLVRKEYWEIKNNHYAELEKSGRLFSTEEFDGFLDSNVHMSPFSIKGFGKGTEALYRMFRKIKRKYKLSKEEISLWEEFISHYRKIEKQGDE